MYRSRASLSLAALAVALGFAALFALPSAALAHDHKDAPAIFGSPFVDVNDIYLFRNPSDPSRLVAIVTTHPLADPDFALTYPFQVNTVYRLQFSSRTDGVPTAHIDFEFSGAAGSQIFTANFAGGVQHTFTGAVTSPTTIKSAPNPPNIVEPANTGIKVTAGPFDDPSFFDVVGFNRVLALLRGQPIEVADKPFPGNDGYANFNVNAIVIEFPIAYVMGTSPRIDAWAVVSSIIDTSLTGAARYADGNLRQIDRMGVPAVNTALIGILPCGVTFPCRGTAPTLGAQKNAFNLGIPQNDAADFGTEIVVTLRDFYDTSNSNIAILGAIGLPDTLKLDTRNPDGFPNGRRPEDDVADVLLGLISNGAVTGDGVDVNDINNGRFLTTFPYLLPPQQASQKKKAK